MRDGDWAKVYAQTALDDARCQDLPTWFRVYSYAFARMGLDGHAPLARGELKDVLFSIGEDGQIKEISSSSVNKAIKKAIELGMLHPSSNIRCLVVPAHRAEYKLGPARSGRTIACTRHDEGGMLAA